MIARASRRPAVARRRGRDTAGPRRWGRAAAALAAGALALLAGTGRAGAGTVTSPVVVTVQPNNDDAGGGNPNLIEFSGFLSGPADLVFTVTPSVGVTEYLVSAGVDNESGFDWSAFRFELGFGTGVDFVPAGGGLDFDTPDTTPGPTSSPFTVIEHGPVLLRFSGGTVPVVFGASFAFALDVPDTGPDVPASALVAEGYQFTLRLVPEAAVPVPLPAPGVLLGAGGLLLAAARLARWRPSS